MIIRPFHKARKEPCVEDRILSWVYKFVNYFKMYYLIPLLADEEKLFLSVRLYAS